MPRAVSIRLALFLLTAGVGMGAGVAAPLTVTTTSLSNGTVNTGYSATLIATGGTAPYIWTLRGTLPAGLALSPAGLISGSPLTATTASFGINLQDAAGGSVLASLSIKINSQNLAVTTQSPLPAGIAGSEYPQRILTASGGTPPYAFTVTSGALPPGLALTGGVITGTPTLSGSFTFTITVTDSASARATAALSVSIAPSATGLVLSSGSLSFSLAETAGTPPSSQRVRVLSSLSTQQINYTVSVSASASWLSVTGGLSTLFSTPGALDFTITDAALPLLPGVFQTTVGITCTSTPCQGKLLSVPVTLTITSVAARLKVLNDVLSYTSDLSAPTAPMVQQLQVRNSGGSSLAVTSVVCPASWCSVGTFPAAILGGVTAAVPISVTAGTLTSGTYRTTLIVTSSAGSDPTPVTLVVPRKPTMGLPSGGSTFSMPAGGAPGKTTGSFSVTASGGPFSWTATASSSPAWLVVATPSGTASPTQKGTVQFSINTTVAAGLVAKTYYGAITVAANGVANAPQEYRVILTVTAATDPVRPQLEPAGLVFTTTAARTVTGTVSVQAASKTPVSWQAAARTSSGGGWLSVSPVVGTASAQTPGVSTISANPSGLSPGIYTGSVSYAFSSAAIRTANVTLVVTAAAVASSRQPHLMATSTCSPTAIGIANTGLVNDFSAPTSWPVPIAVNLINDCGNTVANGQVVATFTNGDPPLSMPLIDASTGLYAATWVPRKSTSQVTISTRATVTGLPVATATLNGEVVPNSEPSLNAYAVLNVFDPQVGGALAPGTVVAMYGANLTGSVSIPLTLPLPVSAGGTQVIIGGIPAPIYFASPGQINAQVPFELDPTAQYEVVISANGALTTPQAVQMSPASPGIAANADTTVIAQHGDYSLVTAAAPAQPGEYIVLYVAGMGATDTLVASGAGAPVTPLAHAAPAPNVTIDGIPVPVFFAGLTPRTVGLYQINLLVPVNTGNGNHDLVVTPSSGGAASNVAILPVHK